MEFALRWDEQGSPVGGFRPDFWLPDRGLFIELTTADQRLVTRKNGKVRRMRELYPEVPVAVVYQRDFLALLTAHGLDWPSRPPPNLDRWPPPSTRTTWRGRSGCPLARGPRGVGRQDGSLRRMGDAVVLPVGDRGRASSLPPGCRGLRCQPSGHRPARGPDAFDHLQRSLSNDLRRISAGRAQYTHLLDETGSVADDIIVWWLDESDSTSCPTRRTPAVWSRPSGVTTPRDAGHHRRPGTRGPRAAWRRSAEAAARCPDFTSALRVARCDVPGGGTGYTGEDGVECAVPAEAAEFWAAILAAGCDAGRTGGTRHPAPGGGPAAARP